MSWIGIGNTIMRCGSAPALTAEEIALPFIADTSKTEGWYLSQDLTTITKNGSDIISVWKDKNGSGHDIGSASGPLWSIDGILFNGANQNLYAGWTWTKPCFFFLVMKQITWTASDYIFDGIPQPKTVCFQTGTTPNISLYAGNTACANTDLILDTWSILRALFNGASSKLIINNGTPSTGNAGANDSNGFILGSGSGATFSHIQVKEVILRNTIDNETEIYNYLAEKYSI